MTKFYKDRLGLGCTLLSTLGMLVVLLTGCSKGDKKPATVGSAAQDTTSTAALVSPDSQQLDFFAERYLSPKERLERRQARLESILAAP